MTFYTCQAIKGVRRPVSAFYYFISLLIENVFFPPLEWQRLEIVLNLEKKSLALKMIYDQPTQIEFCELSNNQ